MPQVDQCDFLRLLVVCAIVPVLAACTHMYQRRFVVEPDVPLTVTEKRKVFESFKTYLISKGLAPLATPRSNATDVVAFQIGGGTTGLLTRSPFREILELRFVDGKDFELRLVRVVSHPVDFSEQGLAKFMTESEAFIQEASSHRVRLRLAASGT